MPTAYSYLRFSTPEQMRGDSFRRQTALAEEYVRRNRLTLDKELTFFDQGVSAFRGSNAKQGALRAFLTAVEDGTIAQGSLLLVESLDRISREQIMEAQGLFMLILSKGITIVTLTDQRVYSAASINANPTDMIISLVAMMRANEESATKSRRVAEAWKNKRARALQRPLTSVCPAWLELDASSGRFVVLEDRAEIVRRIFAEALAGRGQHGIAERLNRDGIPTFGHRGRRGSHWRRSYIVKILSNPAVIGIGTPHRIEHVDGRKVRRPLEQVPDYFPAIVAPDEFQTVQALGTSRNPQRGRHAAHPVANILGGLGRCSACGSAVTLVSKGGASRFLVCSAAKAGAGCKYRAIPYAKVEAHILAYPESIAADAPSGQGQEMALQDEFDRWDAAHTGLLDEARQLLDAITSAPGPVPALLTTRLAEKEAEMAEAQRRTEEIGRQLAALTPGRIQARLDAFCAAGSASPLDRGAVNAALRALLDAAVINTEERTIHFKWKHAERQTQVFYWVPDASEEPGLEGGDEW